MTKTFFFLILFSAAAYSQDSSLINYVPKDSLETVMNRLCTVMDYEFTDLYELTSDIPNDEHFILKKYLEDKDFVQTNWGRGNWDKGPRIVVLDFEKAGCLCSLIKKYYSDYDGKKDQKLYKVTEEIKCSQSKK